MWGAGEDDRTGKQRGAAAEKFDDGWDIENHVVRIPVLHRLAVENRAYAERVGIWNFIRRDETWAERGEGVEGFSTTPLAAPEILLPIAGADIIRAGVAEDIFESAGAGGVLAFFPDDDGELAFVVDLVTGKCCGNFDGIAGMLQGSG